MEPCASSSFTWVSFVRRERPDAAVDAVRAAYASLCLPGCLLYTSPFYRHKGWEIVSDKMTFRIRDNQLPKPQPCLLYTSCFVDTPPAANGIWLWRPAG